MLQVDVLTEKGTGFLSDGLSQEAKRWWEGNEPEKRSVSTGTSVIAPDRGGYRIRVYNIDASNIPHEKELVDAFIKRADTLADASRVKYERDAEEKRLSELRRQHELDQLSHRFRR